MKVSVYAGYGKYKRRKTRRRGRRSIGAASRHCAGLGKRKRKTCMRRYLSGRGKVRRARRSGGRKRGRKRARC